jgi:hypothetical protein
MPLRRRPERPPSTDTGAQLYVNPTFTAASASIDFSKDGALALY